MKCPRCDKRQAYVVMLPARAMQSTLTVAHPPVIPLEWVDCLKCPQCGYSVQEAPRG